MTSATEVLRRMLDERGVRWRADLSVTNKVEWTIWPSPWFREVWAKEIDGRVSIFNAPMTPAQAVEATLGRGTCKDERSGTVAFKCSECGCWVAYDEDWSTGVYAWVGDEMKSIFPHYCPNCGAEVVE